ncbi:MAG: transposase [Kiritimatiellae bacterium]|nr:transposase [Kiritimatiellia bacterium]
MARHAAGSSGFGGKSGHGFPVMRALAVFSLASGAISHIVTAACYAGEMAMLKLLWRTLLTGDIALGDRMYGCFVFLAAMPLQGVDVVARLSQGRNLDLWHVPKLGPNDWLTSLPKPPIPPAYMTPAEWKILPAIIPVRSIRSCLQIKGSRTRTLWIVTTLLDAQRYHATAICNVYLQRWQMELSFRDLKTTMGMEAIRCRTPDMIEKELRVFLIAYNCVRALMAEAAITPALPRQRISFKGAVDSLRSFTPVMLRTTSKRSRTRLHLRLRNILAADVLPVWAGRSEPRAVKMRPKHYPLLTKPRRVFKPLPHNGEKQW